MTGADGKRILTIIGPTAVGKTAVALTVARAIGGEIVSADSRQVYRGMDVGTAKPNASERALVRHHLIDVVDPCETYDAARFAADAEDVIGELLGRGAATLVVGGTGFYLASLFEGLFEGPGRDDELRERLRTKAAEEGLAALHRRLSAVDPEAAARIHVNDGARIIRALEVFIATGVPLSEWHEGERRPPAFGARYFGLTADREALYKRIDARVDAMMEAGLLEEIASLVAAGALSSSMPAASAVGYRELLPLVEERAGAARGAADIGRAGAGDTDPAADLAQAVELIKRNTRRYAKRQMTWFGSVEDVTWIDVGETGPEGAAEAILAGPRAKSA